MNADIDNPPSDPVPPAIRTPLLYVVRVLRKYDPTNHVDAKSCEYSQRIQGQTTSLKNH
jgi:hypothetical protein